jgi:formate hydrogenlyase subunit 3/multisubunit Na+/H+ antiporter MnhD subunit
MALEPNPTDPKPSREEASAKVLNVIMVTTLGAIVLAFTAWSVFEQTLKVLHADASARGRELETLLSGVVLLVGLIVFAARFGLWAWRRRQAAAPK